ncbi:MAG: hypothetical protein M0Z55_11260, partial [Peptococcaceae bacterium]|nr:hypothetical protein [Peptococcaceae bacterium]
PGPIILGPQGPGKVGRCQVKSPVLLVSTGLFFIFGIIYLRQAKDHPRLRRQMVKFQCDKTST